eukprot:3613146-Amphidinium_carterae.1
MALEVGCFCCTSLLQESQSGPGVCSKTTLLSKLSLMHPGLAPGAPKESNTNRKLPLNWMKGC